MVYIKSFVYNSGFFCLTKPSLWNCLKISNHRKAHGYNGNVLEKLKISTCKHGLVDSAEANKDGDWSEIRCT